jgi:hypothetical protein
VQFLLLTTGSGGGGLVKLRGSSFLFKMKFMKLGSNPDTFQDDGNEVR